MGSTVQIKDKSETAKLIKIAPFKKEVRKTEPHKHNSYFEIIYLSKGSGTHAIDYKKYPVEPPVIFFVRKEQVHHWELLSEPEGYVVILKKSFMDKSFDGELKALLIKLSKLSCLQIKDIDTIDYLFQLLTKENEIANDNHFLIIEGLLKALLAKILDTATPIINKVKIKAGLFHSFRELLEQGTDIKNSVAHYAHLLNATPQNLNTACRNAANQSAAEILAEHIISEAKRLLIYTNNTVSEIAASLDFSDASHFVKYFKRHTSQTPLAFRKQ
ncbi:AraC family transcriptional regulator [Parasediminibacterium paludis]|uniref:AraC family transcriptional regulator n=1 Tax=Parasediminibacterium paludis TaxID=908966 RepID=A0ABV8PWI8_9BACT